MTTTGTGERSQQAFADLVGDAFGALIGNLGAVAGDPVSQVAKEITNQVLDDLKNGLPERPAQDAGSYSARRSRRRS